MHGHASDTEKEYKLGQEELRLQNYSQALDHFSFLLALSSPSDPMYPMYQSYQGLCQVLVGEEEGILLCRQSAKSISSSIEIKCNLALAELQLNKRHKAISIVESGLKLDPSNKHLKKLHSRLETRRKPFLPFVSRDNVINVAVGKISYKANKRRSETMRIGKYSNCPMSFIV